MKQWHADTTNSLRLEEIQQVIQIKQTKMPSRKRQKIVSDLTAGGWQIINMFHPKSLQITVVK